MFFIMVVLLIGGSLFGYTQQELEAMRNNSDWIVGKGTSPNESKADQKAIKDLLSQISVQVKASFEELTVEDNGCVEEYSTVAVNTYSNARLDAAERNIFNCEDDYVVYRFIRKTDYNKIFDDRKRMIQEYAQCGFEAEEELRIQDALLNYYWSLVLLRTHPDWDTINANGELLISSLPDRISRIFSLLDLSIEQTRYIDSDDLTLVTVGAMFDGKPVQNLCIKYYLGNDWSIPDGFKSGRGSLEFHGRPERIPDPITIRVLFNDPSRASFDNDLERVLQEEYISLPVFSESRFELSRSRDNVETSFRPQVKIEPSLECVDFVQYETLVNRICRAIESRDDSNIRQLFTDNGWDDYQRIVRYGKAYMLTQDPILNVRAINGITYVRGLPLQFNFPQSGRTFSEEMVFTFEGQNRVDRITFGLSEMAIGDIVGKLNATPEEKQHILDFIEDYKTAYCTKNMDYIEKVFDDNALIIVGRMLKHDEIDKDYRYQSLNRDWEPVPLSKKQYIERLRKLFDANEFVNIHFEDNNVMRSNDPSSKVFGIQIHQYYYSQRYADEGYLFLMFDLTDIKAPRIYVRTWQPEKNPDGSIFGLGDFYLPDSTRKGE